MFVPAERRDPYPLASTAEKRQLPPCPEREEHGVWFRLALARLACRDDASTTSRPRAAHGGNSFPVGPVGSAFGEVKCLGYLENRRDGVADGDICQARRGSAVRPRATTKASMRLAQSVIRLPDHRALRDAGMRQQRVFDFLAADLDAAGVDDVVDPARHPEKVCHRRDDRDRRCATGRREIFCRVSSGSFQ